MAIKSSNVTARVEPEIKEQAEAILAQLVLQANHYVEWASVPSIDSYKPPAFTGRND